MCSGSAKIVQVEVLGHLQPARPLPLPRVWRVVQVRSDGDRGREVGRVLTGGVETGERAMGAGESKSESAGGTSQHSGTHCNVSLQLCAVQISWEHTVCCVSGKK